MKSHVFVTDKEIKQKLTKKVRRYSKLKDFPGGSVVDNLPPKQETWVQSLGREYPLEKEMAIQSSTIAWKIPWTEKPGRLQSLRSLGVGHD